MKIKMTPVSPSTNIVAIGYDEPSKTLRVAFKVGGVYDYGGVPPDLHASFMDSPSYGVFHATQIRGKFPHVHLPAEPVAEPSA